MNRTALRLGAPLALFALSALAIPACSSEALKNAEDQADCSASLEGKAFVNAVGDLQAAADGLKVGVATSCRNIAVAGGKTTQWDGTGTPTDDQVTDACTAASATIDAAVSAGASLTISGSFECHADVSAQADCTAKCSGDASCTGDLSVQCEPGKFEATCMGTCMAQLVCDWDGKSPVDCQGECDGSCDVQLTAASCSGSCEGDCSGTCSAMGSNGKCAGKCTGMCTGTCQGPSGTATCMGKCEGSCKITDPVQCSGGAKCTGSCSGTVQAPTCKGQVQPPKCMASGSCQGNCQASAQAKASCTYPTLVVSGMADATLAAAIQAELPKLYVVAIAQGKNLVAVLTNVSGGIQGAVAHSAGCALQLQGFLSASVSINVSVSASASASGKASGGLVRRKRGLATTPGPV